MHILNSCTLTRTGVGHYSSGTGQLLDLAGEEPGRAGERTYPAREVAGVDNFFVFHPPIRYRCRCITDSLLTFHLKIPLVKS